MEPAPGVGDAEPLDADGPALATLAASVAAVVVLTGLARSVPRTLAVVAVATLVGLGLNPALGAIERRLRVPRGAAIAILLAGVAASVTVLAFALLPTAVAQVRNLDEDVPVAVRELAEIPIVGDEIARADVADRVERFIDELPARLLGEGTPLVDVARRAADGMLLSGMTLLLVVTLLLDGRRLATRSGRLLPERHQQRARRLGDIAYRSVGRYVTGSLTVAVVAGLFTLVTGLAFGVPLAPLLALWVMVWDLVPQIGGAAGGLPFVGFALTQGAGPGLACAALFVVYLQIENHLLGPLLVGSAVKLSPPATMVAALIGVSAGGVVGALVAVPLAGAAKAVYVELRTPSVSPPPATA